MSLENPMSPAKRFLDALSFFTSLVPARLVSNSTLGECAPWIFPCGLVIGALCTLASLAASILLTRAATCPDVIALLLAALVWILAELRITRALHWDGLADLADAIGSYKEGEAFRAVLKDSRIGTFGVLALICAFACELLAVAAHLHILSLTSVAALVLAPAWGRGMAVPLFCLASPHDTTGLGGQFACAGTRDNLALSIILAALTLGFLALAGVHPLNLCALLLLQMRLLWKFVALSRQYDGYSGDFCGCLMQTGQILFLLVTI